MSSFVRRVSGVVARFLDGPPPVEAERASEIDEAWRAALERRPKMFDGRILLADRVALEGDTLEVDFREAGFSTLMWLRGAGASEARLFNVFGAAAVISRDGAALLGRMAPHTANAGQIYFPCGTPDLGDVCGETVDLEGSIARELAEETGLAAPVVRSTEKAIAIFDGRLVGFIRRFETDLDAGELEARALAHLAAEREPELDRIVMARSAAELGDASPRYVELALGALLGD
ncbi:NUDIX hydrolase [Chelatococcus sambhunathii]|uniref:NUDIX hydrolase n=1 Tax=Chelatococcus sambhunathii TaxID=363953 RepID=A0ABU1DE62_9HYPH|nr:NUDIX domain-containing protein [Chelatococcus sambhunathii]MDR4306391.1 NUDIX hydrolase [Chelatococcus sambhunathii]